MPVRPALHAIALVLLYELSVQVTRIHDRRAAKRQRLSELSDDEASLLPDAAAGADIVGDLEVQPVAAARPISSPAPGPAGPTRPTVRRVDDLGDAT